MQFTAYKKLIGIRVTIILLKNTTDSLNKWRLYNSDNCQIGDCVVFIKYKLPVLLLGARIVTRLQHKLFITF